MNPRDWWPENMKNAWEKASDSHRFVYKMNRWVVLLFVIQMALVWLLFLFTAIFVSSWDSQLTSFLLIYTPLTIGMCFILLRWRAFTILSVVVLSGRHLYWTQGRKAYVVERKSLDLQKMGLTNVETWNRFEASFEIDLDDGQKTKLYLYRPFAYLENLEGLMQQLLQRK